MQLPSFFSSLSSLYKENGFSLYLVGGSARDLILGGFCRDFDLVSNATPSQEKAFLSSVDPNLDMTFSRFGTICLHYQGEKIDIATFRYEEGYSDHRHPKKIVFIDSMEEDSLRRDFTINALYVDEDGKIYDFHGGMADLEAKLIRFIGDPRVRIEEDPLRILRAKRFAKRLGFEIEESAAKAMEELAPLLDTLNPEKVKMEMRKR